MHPRNRMEQSIDNLLSRRLVSAGYDPNDYQINYAGDRVVVSANRGLLSWIDTLTPTDLKQLQHDLVRVLQVQNPGARIDVSEPRVDQGQLVFRASLIQPIELPSDMLWKVLSYLPPKTVPTITKMEDPYVWRQFVNQQYGLDYSRPEQIDWKDLHETLRGIQGPITLEAAVREQSPDLIKILLQQYPELDANSALMLAVELGAERPVIAALLDPRRIGNDTYNKAFDEALILMNAVALNELASRASYLSPMVQAILAAFNADHEEFDRIISANPDINTQELAEGVVALKDPYFTARLLEDPRIDPNANNSKMLAKAIVGDNLENVRVLLADPRIWIDQQNANPLLLAMYTNDPEMMRLLLTDHRIDPLFMNGVLFNQMQELAKQRNNFDVFKVYYDDPRVQAWIRNRTS